MRLALIAAVLVPATASALHIGELAGNAYTTPAKTWVIHPLSPSSYAISEGLELKTSILGLIGGPFGAVEYQLVRGDAQAISVEAWAETLWLERTMVAGGLLGYSRQIGSSYFTASSGLRYTRETTHRTRVSFVIPVTLKYEIPSGDSTIWEIYGTVFTNVPELIRFSTGVAGVAGFNWNVGLGDNFRLALGLLAYVGAVPAQIVDTFDIVGLDVEDLPVLPLANASLWFTF